MVQKKAVSPEVLLNRRKELAARVQECEGKIKRLARELKEEKAKPSFKTSKDPRHLKFQEAARRKVEKLQTRIDELEKQRAVMNAEVKRLSLILKGQA